MKYFMDRRFRHVRFATDPGTDPNNDVGEGGGAGGSSNDDVSIEELKLQLAKEKAEKERFKSSIDKLTKQNKELTDQTRQYMTDEQKAKADKEAKEQELEDLKREVRVSKYSKRLVGIGMEEEDADKMAGILPDLEDADGFFDAFGKFVEGVKKAAGESAVLKLLKDRPGVNAGNGESKMSIAEERAQAIGKRSAGMAEKSNVTDYYKI